MPEIQHYCTAKMDEMQDTAQGLLCTRCNHTLVDLGDPVAVENARRSGSLGCGFIRRLAIPALASVALSNCTTSHQINGPMPVGMKGKVAVEPSDKHKPSEDPVPMLAGRIAPLHETPVDLPTAEWLKGRPNLVTSPYTGQPVDVEGIPAGKKVIDPTTGKDKKLFRVPKKKR